MPHLPQQHQQLCNLQQQSTRLRLSKLFRLSTQECHKLTDVSVQLLAAASCSSPPSLSSRQHAPHLPPSSLVVHNVDHHSSLVLCALTSLDMSYCNGLTDNAAVYFAKLISGGRLEELFLQECDFGDEAAFELTQRSSTEKLGEYLFLLPSIFSSSFSSSSGSKETSTSSRRMIIMGRGSSPTFDGSLRCHHTSPVYCRASLKVLNISGWDRLTDDGLAGLLLNPITGLRWNSSNTLLLLKELHLADCTGLTDKSIDILLQSFIMHRCNHSHASSARFLRKLDLSRCVKMTRRAAERLKRDMQLIRDDNFRQRKFSTLSQSM